MNGENETIRIIAKNIADLRKSGGMTQAGLAEQLGYSDKSISKWERGEGLPDVLCLKKIADLFGVRVDWFFEEEHSAHPSDASSAHSAGEALPEDTSSRKKSTARYVTSHTAVSLVSVAGVWMLAVLAFVISALCHLPSLLPFIIAVPVSALLLLIFHAMWGREKKRRLGFFVTVTFLVWSVLFLVCWICREYNLWLLMILGFPATLIAALACRIRKKLPADEKNEDA